MLGDRWHKKTPILVTLNTTEHFNQFCYMLGDHLRNRFQFISFLFDLLFDSAYHSILMQSRIQGVDLQPTL